MTRSPCAPRWRQHTHASEREAREREELLTHRSNAAVSSIVLDNYAAESSSLSRSNRMANEYLETGREALQSLVGQRERLKGAHQKALDMLNLLGISQSVMRVMQRRNITDRYIVYAVTLAFMLLIYYVTRG